MAYHAYANEERPMKRGQMNWLARHSPRSWMSESWFSDERQAQESDHAHSELLTKSEEEALKEPVEDTVIGIQAKDVDLAEVLRFIMEEAGSVYILQDDEVVAKMAQLSEEERSLL